MKKFSALLILIVTLLLPVGLVFAGTFRSPDKDTTCDASNCFDGFGISTLGSQNIASPGSCLPDQAGLIGWTLAVDETTYPIASAILTMTVQSQDDSGTFVTTPGTYDFALVTPNNHTWAANGPNPGYGAVIATSTGNVISAGGEKVVFNADVNGLGGYFAGLNIDVANPAPATVGIIMTNGCTAPSHTVVFQDNDPVGFTGADEPDLVFYPGPGATAVSLSETGTSAGGLNPSVLFGGAALLVATAWALISLRNRKSVDQL